MPPSGLRKVAPGRGRKPTIPATTIRKIVEQTLHSTPPGGTHWSCSSMAKAVAVSPNTVNRIWRENGLKTSPLSQFKERPFPSPPGQRVTSCVGGSGLARGAVRIALRTELGAFTRSSGACQRYPVRGTEVTRRVRGGQARDERHCPGGAESDIDEARLLTSRSFVAIAKQSFGTTDTGRGADLWSGPAGLLLQPCWPSAWASLKVTDEVAERPHDLAAAACREVLVLHPPLRLHRVPSHRPSPQRLPDRIVHIPERIPPGSRDGGGCGRRPAACRPRPRLAVASRSARRVRLTRCDVRSAATRRGRSPAACSRPRRPRPADRRGGAASRRARARVAAR